ECSAAAIHKLFVTGGGGSLGLVAGKWNEEDEVRVSEREREG
ncbi:hypothetical protein L195_g043843, partial [Trifolium pratense]